MKKQQQIEEMISAMAASNNPFVDVPIEIMPKVAKYLYNAGYRQVPDGAVVLTKEDLKHYAKDCFIGELAGYDILNGLIERAKRKEAQVRKETAEKFAEKLKEICVRKREFIDIDDEEEYYFDGAVTINEIDELLKQYGVEIKE